jgi:hypothetical protein
MRALDLLTIAAMSWAVIGATQIAGLFLDLVSRVSGTIMLVTGMAVGGMRALAILLGATPGQVEWMTAVGFAAGIGISLAVFTLDFFWG